MSRRTEIRQIAKNFGKAPSGEKCGRPRRRPIFTENVAIVDDKFNP